MIEVLTGILIAITAYYAWQTRQSVKIMEQSSLPYVSVHLDNEPSHITDIYLVIRNDGDQSAFDLTLEVIGGDVNVTEAASRGGGKLSEMLFIKSKLAVLSPRSEKKHLITMTTPESWKELKNTQTTIKVSYRDKKGRIYGQAYDLDYASLPFTGTPRDSTYQRPEKSLQNIDKTLQEIAKNDKD